MKDTIHILIKEDGLYVKDGDLLIKVKNEYEVRKYIIASVTLDTMYNQWLQYLDILKDTIYPLQGYKFKVWTSTADNSSLAVISPIEVKCPTCGKTTNEFCSNSFHLNNIECYTCLKKERDELKASNENISSNLAALQVLFGETKAENNSLKETVEGLLNNILELKQMLS